MDTLSGSVSQITRPQGSDIMGIWVSHLHGGWTWACLLLKFIHRNSGKHRIGLLLQAEGMHVFQILWNPWDGLEQSLETASLVQLWVGNVSLGLSGPTQSVFLFSPLLPHTPLAIFILLHLSFSLFLLPGSCFEFVFSVSAPSGPTDGNGWGTE